MKTFKTSEVKVPQLATALALSLMTAACATPPVSGPDPVPVQVGNEADSRVERLLRYCERLHETGDVYMASGMCVRAHELNPSEPRPMMKLAEIFTQADRKEDAISAYRTVLKHNPGHPEALYHLGRLYLDVGEEEKALQTFEIAALRDPENWRVHNVIGVLKDKRGQHAVAQEHYRAALDADPENLSVKSNLGLSLALAGEKEEALEVLGQVVADPNASAVAFHNLEIAQNVPDPEAEAENVVEDPSAVESLNLSQADPVPAPMSEMMEDEAGDAEDMVETEMEPKPITPEERAEIAALDMVGQDDTALSMQAKSSSGPYGVRPSYVGSYPVALLPRPNPARPSTGRKQDMNAPDQMARRETKKVEPAISQGSVNLEKEMILKSKAESTEIAKAEMAPLSDRIMPPDATNQPKTQLGERRLQLVALSDPSIRPISGSPQVTFRGRY